MILNDYVVRGNASAIHIGVLGLQADASVIAIKPTWIRAFNSGQIARSIQAFDRSNHDMTSMERRHIPHENGVTLASMSIMQCVSPNLKNGTYQADALGETSQSNDVLPRDKQELRRGPVRPQPRPNNRRAARTKN